MASTLTKIIPGCDINLQLIAIHTDTTLSGDISFEKLVCLSSEILRCIEVGSEGYTEDDILKEKYRTYLYACSFHPDASHKIKLIVMKALTPTKEGYIMGEKATEELGKLGIPVGNSVKLAYEEKKFTYADFFNSPLLRVDVAIAFFMTVPSNHGNMLLADFQKSPIFDFLLFPTALREHTKAKAFNFAELLESLTKIYP